MARLWLAVLLAVTSTFTSISPAASRALAVTHTSQQGSRSQQGQARTGQPTHAASLAATLPALPRLANVIAADPPATATTTLDFSSGGVDLSSLRAAPNALGLLGQLPATNGPATAPVATAPRAAHAADDAGALLRAPQGSSRLPGLAGWTLPRAAPDIRGAAATTYTVTTTADSGSGSLRQAITNADANGGGLITFSVSGTIALQSALPIITQTVSISGSSAPGATPITPTVTINGSALSTNPAGGVDGLVFTAANSGVNDLNLNGFNATGPTNFSDAIAISGVSAISDVVAGNFIGTDITGTTAITNFGGVFVTRGATGATITGNLVSGNTFGVTLSGAGTNGNAVQSNKVGTDVSGTTPISNYSGILVQRGAMSATITGNLVSGNTFGVDLLGAGTTGNIVQSNLVGTNRAGTVALPNVNGIVMERGASNNTIGGVTPGSGNLVSGNANGVAILGATYPGLTSTVSSSGNIVAGNLIGTNIGGTAAIPNTMEGVGLAGGATGNVIGGGAAAARNTISGNTAGVVLQDAGTMSNTVDGNFIGTIISGTAALPNGLAGVVVQGGASGNTIGGTNGGNTISGNTRGAGVVIAGINLVTGQLAGTATSGNVVEGNRIGTDPSGTMALSNTIGVVVNSGAVSNTIGGTATNAENVVSGNASVGVAITGTGALLTPGGSAPLPTNGNLVQGNEIGTNITGTAALGNGQVGVVINARAMSNTVGGAASGAGNLISGQGNGFGVFLNDAGSNGNVVQGNKVGTDGAGMSAIRNYAGVFVGGGAANNTIGGATAAAANLVSGGSFGIVLSGAGTTGNTVLGNDVGTDATRTSAIPNGAGIQLQGGASGNTVGGAATGAVNLVSGNVLGIVLRASGTSNNQVLGNLVGTNINGTAALPNQQAGVLLSLGAVSNTIGGPDPADRNLVSGNFGAGIAISDTGTSNNAVLGNLVGTNISGAAALPNNLVGVAILGGATNNTIGGTANGAGNVVSGNPNGIALTDRGTNNNTVLGNFVGTTASGTAALPNTQAGVVIQQGAMSNTIGGTASGAVNVVSGNLSGTSGVGIVITGTGTMSNSVQGNDIGLSLTSSPLPNGIGVFIFAGASNNTVGGTTAAAANTIAYNGKGVVVGFVPGDAGATGNAVRGNSIYSNQMLGIDLGNDGVTPNGQAGRTGPNRLQNYPLLSSAQTDGTNLTISGVLTSTADTTYTVEVFDSPTCDLSGFGQGQVFLGFVSVTTDGSGMASFTLQDGSAMAGSFVTTTATDPNGNTSEFSACTQVIETPPTTPGGTATGTPNPSATGTATTQPSGTATTRPSSTSTSTNTPSSTATPTNTATNTPTNTATNTATNTPTNTATATPTSTATQAPTNTTAPTATPFPTLIPLPTPTGAATSQPTGTSVPQPRSTSTPRPTRTPVPPPVSRACQVTVLFLYGSRFSVGGLTFYTLPNLSVNRLSATGGRRPRITSPAPLYASDGRVTFYSNTRYRSLACGPSALVGLTGAIFIGRAPGRHGTVDLSGGAFALRVTADRRRAGRQQTYTMRLQIPAIRYNHTFKGLQGTVRIRR